MRFSVIIVTLAIACTSFAVPTPPHLPQEIKNQIAHHVDANAAAAHRAGMSNPVFGAGGVPPGGQTAQRLNAQRGHEHTNAEMLRKNAGPRRN